ncbi:MAG: cupredoxin domain-containing protein [Candidatus Kryptoniota bacterium]
MAMTRIMALVLLGLAAGIVAFAPLPLPAGEPKEHTFRLEARQFAYSPSELRLNPGDAVTIQLVSTDVVHGLYIDGYDLSLEADPGQTATLTFVADKPGSFRFRCNVTCGAMHPFMIGKIIVGTNEWLYRSIGLVSLVVIGFFSLSSFPTERNKNEERSNIR